jgi:hypothetical protein
MTAPTVDSSSELHRLALEKMSAVLGRVRASELLHRILGELRIELRTPQDLLEFSEALAAMGGFEGAVGAMLGVTAVLRGATPKEGGAKGNVVRSQS